MAFVKILHWRTAPFSPGALQLEFQLTHYEHPKHSMNRYSDKVRERIENHLNMVLRADPAGSAGVNVCRVYSPEVNTLEKLRKLLTSLLEPGPDEEVKMSTSTMQRMINEYLDSRKLRISFKQTDHNACPNCKTLQYAVLQFH